MGIAVGDAADVARAIAARQAERWDRIVPPVHVVGAERPGTIDVALPADTETVSWTLTAERGVPDRGSARWSRLPRTDGAPIAGRARELRTLPLGALAAGYYSLSVAAGDRGAGTTVVAAPEQCWLPPCLRRQPDGRVWGLAVQLYGLRSARNWG